jgi:hypothetical protein
MEMRVRLEILLMALFHFNVNMCSSFFYSLPSENVTNFLSSDWKAMSLQEAALYLTPYEVCIMQHSVGSKLCDVYFEHVDKQLGDCHVFSEGLVNKCPNHLGSLFRHKSTNPWPRSKNILDLIKLMRDRGSNTLFLIGDSMTQQHLFDIHCSLLRFQIPSIHTNIPNNHNVYHKEMKQRDPVSLQYTSPPFFQLHFIKYEPMALDGWTALIDKTLTNSSVTPSITGTPVFVVNVGLHAATPTGLRDIATSFFAPLLRVAEERRGLVIYRETSAQHFPSLHGMYETLDSPGSHENVPLDLQRLPQDLAQRVFDLSSSHTESDGGDASKRTEWPELKTGCPPLPDMESFRKQNWRNEEVTSLLQVQDPQGLVQVAPFYRVSAGRHDFHLHLADCTHYCHGPMLWLPLSHSIFEIVNKKLDAANNKEN